MSYAINGSSTSVGPVSVNWIPIEQIRDFNNQPVYSGYRVELGFEAMAVADAAQWLNSTSSGSVNLTILDRWSLNFTTLSGVYCNFPTLPMVRDVHVEPFTIVINGVY